MRPVLVGELNPYGVDPDFALYPLPEHASGGRLARILGLSRGQYLRAFGRENLCTGRWSMPEARAQATRLSLGALREGCSLILLGRKVSDAFGVPFKPFERFQGTNLFVLPHPSGLNRMWGAADAIERARGLVLPLIGAP